MKCQYCRAETEHGYTCEECKRTWPVDDCTCENNGDYCESCEAWLRKRRGEIEDDEPEASQHELREEAYRETREFNSKG